MSGRATKKKKPKDADSSSEQVLSIVRFMRCNANENENGNAGPRETKSEEIGGRQMQSTMLESASHPEVREKKRIQMQERRALKKLQKRRWDPPKGGRPAPSPEPSEILPRIFSRNDGPEVWEAHEQKMAQRVAEIEAYRERHRKRRKPTGWSPEERAAALAAYRRDRDAAAAATSHEIEGDAMDAADGLDGAAIRLDNPEDSGRREEEVDAALAILALAGDKRSAGTDSDTIPSSYHGTAPLGTLAARPRASVVDSILALAVQLSSHGTELETEVRPPRESAVDCALEKAHQLTSHGADVAAAAEFPVTMVMHEWGITPRIPQSHRPSTRVEKARVAVANLNAGHLSQPTLMDAMMWEDVSPPLVVSWLPMTVETYHRVKSWQCSIEPDNGWDMATAVAMSDLAKTTSINRTVDQIEARLCSHQEDV
ncbi:hypothetical protein B0H11DRAFT_1916874 [Mycena galericulata]|nr:hypothetical protein B0H11DRAFT_1916874 [Mycena galericulata]